MLKEITRNFMVDLMNKMQKCKCPSVWESIHFAKIVFFKMTGGKSGYYIKILQNVWLNLVFNFGKQLFSKME